MYKPEVSVNPDVHAVVTGVNGAIDIIDVVRGLRRQREGMIQTEPQYKFVYIAMEHYIGTMLQRMVSRPVHSLGKIATIHQVTTMLRHL